MDAVFPPPPPPQGLARILGLGRLRFTLGLTLLLGLLISLGWKSGLPSILLRTVTLGLLALLVFGLFEQWPRHLPAWLARWALQVLGVALIMPLGTYLIYELSTAAGAPPFWKVKDRLTGFVSLSAVGLLLAPWVALAALVRQKDALARHQALAFDLERSEFERQALDARLRLLQAQVEPHFLFNTLANVRELVDTGSPRASAVLGSLIAYLRAAVPRLHAPASTLAQELELAQAYLEVMHMRMPDRLQFDFQADDEALQLVCPPMTLLTLVENAVRHGIGPSEEGGRIEVRVRVLEGCCAIEVLDTGVGLGPDGGGAGTGLANLQERLQLAFGGKVRLELHTVEPHGVRAEVVFPAVRGGA
ncbi:MAG: histidine kinase [Geothrix sp.]|nr:histidine kinase [Geothrix sp.]